MAATSLQGTPAADPPAPGLPLHDWQFWVATLVALAAVCLLLAKLTPRRLRFWKRASGGKAISAQRRVQLTAGGKAVATPKRNQRG